MLFLFLTADLMFSSRVSFAAGQIGVSMSVVPTPEQLVERCASEPVALVILDLSLPGLNAASVMNSLRALSVPPKAVVAYAPHVHENLLAAATEAGCTEVLSRGQFNSQIERVLKQYL